MIYAALSMLTRAMMRVRINHTESITYCKKPFIRKSRRWHSALMIATANGLFKLFGVRTRFLHRSAWEHRERDMYRLLYNDDVFVDGHRVYIPERSGRTLHAILTDPACSEARQVSAITASVEALIRLHLTVLPFDERARFLSHADATTFNVICDDTTRSGQWIDFETCHDARCPSVIRHADDLKTFVFSVLSLIPPERWNIILEVIQHQYTETEVWLHVLDAIRYRRRRCILTIAQTRISLEMYRRIRHFLMETEQLKGLRSQVRHLNR